MLIKALSETREVFLRQAARALDRFIYYYNHYRGHSWLGRQAPVLRFVGQAPPVVGVADIPGLEEIDIPGLETATVQPPPEVTPWRVAAMRALAPISAWLTNQALVFIC